MGLLKKPGASLLLVGVVLYFLVRPIAFSLPIVGGVIGSVAWGIGILGMIGGAYLLARSILGPGGKG